MAIASHTSHTSETAILSELIRPEDATLSAPAAEGWLAVRLQKAQLDRMHELVTKNQDDKLTAKEKTELENYRRVSFMLDLIALQSPPVAQEAPEGSLTAAARRCVSSKSTATKP